MKKSVISICYHPTTIVFVDDQTSFLKEVDLTLDSNLSCKFYNNPVKAINFFNSIYSLDPFTSRCISTNTDELDHINLSLDFRAIRNEISNPQRFSQISTVFVDYSMPKINGLECCQKIKDNYIKKVLLTGIADNEIAINAFNKNIINKYITKGAPDTITLILNAIIEFQSKYFIELGEKSNFSLSPIYQCLTDSAFATFFHDLCSKHKIVEYYLVDEQGGFLMLDANGKPSWLAFATERRMDELYDIAKQHKNETPQIVFDLISNRKMLPFFYSDDDLQSAPSEWEMYMHPATKLLGNQTYYYSYISNPNAYDLGTDNVFSYNDFLSNSSEVID